MKRSTRNAVRTKQEIIEKSAPLFNTHGYAATSMKMLVKATGFQMGGIYRHFESKKQLAEAVFTYNYEVLLKRNLEFDPRLNSREQLLSLLDNYKKMVVKPRVEGGCPILNTAIEVDDTDESFRELVKSFVDQILAEIVKVLELGKEEGIFNADIDSKKEALYLFATFEGAIMLGKLSKSAKPLFEIFDQVRLYLENNIFEA
ncbi:MAG: TetR/AcrR family transcriptional regulator [Bacteroidota bacterium]